MMINHDEIKILISILGFTSLEDSCIWEKKYTKLNYKINVDFNKEKILYQVSIILGDETTSNFSNSENFVVLECVDRLLTIGYPPSCITLEKKWPMGRNHKGKLDILIKDKEEKSYLMIECKTWGSEYNKEKKKMLKDGGQLISYYQQDRNAKYLCLYTSRYENNKIEYKNDIIKIEDDFSNLADVKEVYQRWNKQFSQNGIFNEEPYRVELKALIKKDLKELQEEDSSIIYKQFLEILRHNVVSDKSNAFNKIFNLFLCKVLDEDKSDNELLSFQWIEGQDTEESIMKKLNDLYKNGMKKYLHKDITDYNENDLIKYKDDKNILKILNELRLYKSQEFAFLEVFNKSSFKENVKIVKEVVQLLQGWQIRYTHKQQFLGDFFELLLNTGFKQESGQFFTPVPLVRFILKSLPIEEIIQEKIKNNEDDFLPYLIDFACGSGHFLTEAMDIIQENINNIDSTNVTTTQSKKIKHYKVGDFEWAKEFVYGIEKDYRLVKATKLACFLHGDGEAQIIHASGIAPFGKDEYKGKLEKKEQFDILVANPPYSVSGFRSTVKEGNESFSLFKHISDNSSEIEVIFIERMVQLIKPKGIAAIILPSSILSNFRNYERARQLILSNFEIKAIVNIGSGGFMETGTSTVTLFLKKLLKPVKLESKHDYKNIVNNKKIVIVDSGEKEKEKQFLGYEFSKRRGDEGIKILGKGLLYNEENRLDNEFVSSYILKSMLNHEEIIVNDKLKNHISIVPFDDCFDWDKEGFLNSIQIKKKLQISSKYKIVKLGDYVEFTRSSNKLANNAKTIGKYPFFTSSFDVGYCDNPDYLEELIIIGKARYLGVHISNKFSASNGVYLFKGTDNSKISNKYLYYFLLNNIDYLYNARNLNGQYPSLKLENLQNLRIPLPPIDIQEKIIKQIENENNIIYSTHCKIGNINKYIKDIPFPNHGYKLLQEISLMIRRGKSPKYGEGNVQVIKSGQVRGFKEFNFDKTYFLTKDFFVDDRLLQKGDLLINSTGVGTAGRIGLFELDGNFTVDSHITILRLQKGILSQYILYYLFNTYGFDGIEKMANGTSGQIELNLETIKNLKVPIVSLLEQGEIVNKVEKQEEKIQQYKKTIEEAKHKQKQIIKEILGLHY